MTSFTCPYLVDDHCRRLDLDCDPGIRGCVLRGKVVFADNAAKEPTPDEVARARRRVKKRRNQGGDSADGGTH